MNGSWWSTTAGSAINGRYLGTWTSNNVYAQDNNSRGRGFALRCVISVAQMLPECYNDPMATIEYQVGSHKGTIVWAANEHFGELIGKTYSLGKMEATQIELLTDLSFTVKLLLSAVAGAIIQHLLDQGVSAAEVFARGTFTVL